jgi:hypothetical protein
MMADISPPTAAQITAMQQSSLDSQAFQIQAQKSSTATQEGAAVTSLISAKNAAGAQTAKDIGNDIRAGSKTV